jgi:NAD(P)-dependent dehydrogenase (short-subunit alcohol dehydrogenase family)
MMTDTQGPAPKLALVTGASRGIGAATAEALAADGWHVILTARTVKGLEDVEEHIHDSGGTATIAPMDLTDGDSIGRLANAVATRWGKLDALVLNAAMLGTLSPVPHIDAKEFASVLTLNVTAQATLIAAFDALLRAASPARVIGVTSSVGADPRAYWGAYGASKAAFENLLLSYADETESAGRIAVAILDPGATRTSMRAKAYPGEDPAKLKGPEVVATRISTLLRDGFPTRHREAINQPA